MSDPEAPETLAANKVTAFQRLRSLLPRGWFGQERGPTPRLDALLQGPGDVLGLVLTQTQYAALQTRILTATGGWLDLIAFDYFGAKFQRRAGEADQSYRLRIYSNLLRERGTRNGVRQVLRDVTGREPIMREFRVARDNPVYGGPGGYRTGHGYGSVNLPFQGAVVAYRPLPGTTFYGVSDADIYAAVDAVKVYGTRVFLQLRN